MTQVSPNEIIDKWNNIYELVVVISDAPRRDGQVNQLKQTVADAQDATVEDVHRTRFAFEFLDGDGKSIKFPVTLVSETRFERT